MNHARSLCPNLSLAPLLLPPSPLCSCQEHTAIFDVLTPPYGPERSCHYYEAESEGEEAHVLREVPWPDSLDVVNRRYEGLPAL